MPVGFSSAARNLFLLGSTGSVASNFFKQVDESSNSLGTWIPQSIIYNDADQKYILGGYHKDSNTKDRGWISKRNYDAETDPQNPTTTQEWGIGSQYTVPNGGSVRFNSVKLDSTGKVIVAGDFNSGTGNIPLVARYSTTGALEWQATSNYVGRATDITSDDNNNYYICGTDELGEAFIEKYDTDGTPIWGKVVSTGSANADTTLESIGVNDRGHVVAGGTLDATNPHRGYLIKINTETGEVMWDKTFFRAYDENGTFGYNAVVNIWELYIDSKDQIYITGTYGSPKRQWISKLTAEGNIIWQKGTTNTTNVLGGQDILPIGIRSDGETEQTIVLSKQADSSQIYLLLSKYSKSGELVWRRKLDKGNAFSSSPIRSYGASLDADPSFYYISYVDQSFNAVSGTPDTYYFGKVSSSGNGLGAFDYDDGSAVTLEYTISSQTDTTERLKDGSVRNDTSDLISYPFDANKIFFDDFATPVANKKRQVTSIDSVDFSGSPAIRTRDFPSTHLLAAEYSGTGDWLDKSKNEINGTLYNPSHESDPPDHFEINSTRRVELQNYSVAGKTDFSIETWVKFDSLPGGMDTSQGYVWDQSPGQSGCSLRCSSTGVWNIFVYPQSNSIVLGEGSTVTTSLWYHTVAVFNASNNTIKLYLNGDQDKEETGTWDAVKSLESSAAFTIGASTDSLGPAAGEVQYTSPGTYTLDVSNISTVSAVLVGGGGGGSSTTTSSSGISGGGGGGGALSYINDLDVSGQSTLYITVGSGGNGGGYQQNNATAGGDSYLHFSSHSGTIVSRAGGGGKGEYNNPNVVQNGGVDYSGTYGGGGGYGGRGGRGQSGHQCGGGGGAGGYSGTGGRGSDGSNSDATGGSGGGGGGAGGNNSTGSLRTVHGGGGVGIFGTGSNGAAGESRSGSQVNLLFESQGFSGSGGTSEDPTSTSREKGYGGGGNGNEDDTTSGAADGSGGAVRIVWGTSRTFPSTNVGKDESGGGATGDTREYMDGDIAEFRIYDYVLTAAQINQNYNATKSKYIDEATDTAPLVTSNIVVDSNLLLHYDFGNRACYEFAENLVRHSEDFKVDAGGSWGEDSANWLDNSKIIANYALSPFKWDKEIRASKLLNDTGSSKIINYSPNTFLNGSYDVNGQHTISLYAKAISNPCKLVIGQWDGFTFRNTNFDLVSGVVDSTSSTDATSIQAVGDGWYRISSTATNGSSNTSYQMQLVDGIELLMMGAQMEKGNVLGKYNRTYGTTLSLPTGTKNLADGGASGGQIIGATFNRDGYFEFDGTNDRITIPGLSLSTTGGFTVCAWLKMTGLQSGSTWNYFIKDADGLTPVLESGIYNNNNYSFGWKDNSVGVQISTVLTQNQWHYISFGVNSSQGVPFIYKDGSYAGGSGTAFGTGVFPIAHIFGPTGNNLGGHCGAVQAYDRELSGTEVEQNFNATRTRYGV